MLSQTNVTRDRKQRFPGGVSSFGEGRVCTAAGCDTQLSRYNSSDTCASHSDSPRRR